jgi:hypothetical protein
MTRPGSGLGGFGGDQQRAMKKRLVGSELKKCHVLLHTLQDQRTVIDLIYMIYVCGR